MCVVDLLLIVDLVVCDCCCGCGCCGLVYLLVGVC